MIHGEYMTGRFMDLCWRVCVVDGGRGGCCEGGWGVTRRCRFSLSTISAIKELKMDIK